MFEKMTIQQYADLLASHTPTPGGGSALGIIATNAIALIEMATNVTANKLAKKGLDTMQLSQLSDSLCLLRNDALACANDDASAFDGVIGAMRMPKDTEQEVTLRNQAMQSAYIVGASVPLKLMELCSQAITVADQVITLSDKFVCSDAVIGKNLLVTVANNCLHNVTVNTSCITDTQTKQQLENKATELLKEINE